MSTPKEEFLTPEEAAARLKLSVFTLRDYLRQGKVPGVKVGRLWRIPESGLAAMGAAAQVSATTLQSLILASPEADPEQIEALRARTAANLQKRLARKKG